MTSNVDGDARRVTAQGKGLTSATLDQQTSFAVDASKAGQSCVAMYVSRNVTQVTSRDNVAVFNDKCKKLKSLKQCLTATRPT